MRKKGKRERKKREKCKKEKEQTYFAREREEQFEERVARPRDVGDKLFLYAFPLNEDTFADISKIDGGCD